MGSQTSLVLYLCLVVLNLRPLSALRLNWGVFSAIVDINRSNLPSIAILQNSSSASRAQNFLALGLNLRTSKHHSLMLA